MRWWLYNLLFTLVYIVMLPQFLFRMRRRGGYCYRFADRFGRYPKEIVSRLDQMDSRAIWIHAVSVGEVYVAGQVMRSLRDRLPETKFVFSTTSSTGWREAERLIGLEDVLIYNPLDFPQCVKRAVALIRPRALVLTESEIWPNLIRACSKSDVPVYLINARISDRSAPGYRWLRFWFEPVLQMFTTIMAQSEQDKKRLIAAGAIDKKIIVTGSFKFDVAHRDLMKEREAGEFLARHDCGRDRVVLLGGSTWPGEDEILIAIYKRLYMRYPALRLVLVPRHFEKADAVQAKIERAGLMCVRKSCEILQEVKDGSSRLDFGGMVVLVDTTGELMGFYGHAQIVFVGKSLCAHGAQNMIEPCLCGAATLVGPNTENFRSVMADLLSAEALIQVSNAEALEREIERLTTDAHARQVLGHKGVVAVIRRQGVVERCVTHLTLQLG